LGGAVDEGRRRRDVVGAALADRATGDDVVVLGQLADDAGGPVRRVPAIHHVVFEEDRLVLAFAGVDGVGVGPDRVVADVHAVAGVEGIGGIRHDVEELQRRARPGGLARSAGNQVVFGGDGGDLAVLDEEALRASATAHPIAAEDHPVAAPDGLQAVVVVAVLIGDPDLVVFDLQRFEALGLDRVLLTAAGGGVDGVAVQFDV